VGVQLARDRLRLPSTKDPVVGAEGQVATVEANGRSGTVYVNGELWAFDSEDPLSVSEVVSVRAVNGMRLHLEKRRT
jgi:membrane protein implicated in regulation of membrane protease activity